VWAVFAVVVEGPLVMNSALPTYRHLPPPPHYSIDNGAAVVGNLLVDCGSNDGHLVLDAAGFLIQDSE